MTDQTPEVLTSLFEALLAYQDTQEGLSRVRSTAESLWGAAWRRQLPSALQDCPADQKAKIKANIERALAYERAASAWSEAVRLIDPRRSFDPAEIEPRLGEFQKRLSLFGQAGQDMYAKLQKRVEELQSNPVAVSASANSYNLTTEQLWNFDHFVRLKDYYDQTISRTSARCVHLGGLELTQYPYFGYILDLLDEILTFGGELLGDAVYAGIIRDRYKGGEPAMRKHLAQFKKDFEDNAPPEMLDDDDSMDDIKNRLGDLAGNEPEGDIGPAPDGFESAETVSPDPAREASARLTKGPVPMGKMPQKVPVKRPAPAKMPMKRPVSG